LAVNRLSVTVALQLIRGPVSAGLVTVTNILVHTDGCAAALLQQLLQQSS